MANQPGRGHRKGSRSERSGRRARGRKVEMVALSATAHCGPGQRRRRAGLLSIFRTSLLAALLLAPILIAAAAVGQTVTMDHPPDSAYWEQHAPQLRGGPTRSGYTQASLLEAPLMEQWTRNASAPILSSAVLDDKHAYVVDREGVVRAIELATGDTRWTRDLAETVSGTPALAYGWLYVATEEKTLFALSSRDGTVLANTTLLNVAKVGPLVAQGKVFQGTDSGILEVFDAATLDPLWSFDTGVTVYNADRSVNATDPLLRKPLRSPPAFYDGRLYVASWNHRVYALATTGSLHGTPSTIHWTSQVNDIVHAPVAVDRHRNHLLVATADGRLQALTLSGGTLGWTLNAKLGFHGSAAVSKDLIVATSDDGRLLGINHTTGKISWERNDPSGYLGGPMLTRDAVVSVSANGTVHLRSPANGTLLSQAHAPALSFLLESSTHASPAVSGRGIVITDHSGNVTLIGPQPDLRADLRAGAVNFIGTVAAGRALNLTVTAENMGPDHAVVMASVYVDDVLRTSADLPALGAAERHDWAVSIDGVSGGAHTIRVVFRPVGATDPTPDDAERTADLAFASTTDPYADYPRLPDGSIDWEAVDAEDGADAPQNAPGLADGFAAAMSGWLLVTLLVAAAAGVAAARLLRTRAARAANAA